ncbi:MAG: hydrogenase maturation nickel metallochaperone HypA [Bifidobacteriaceae bacterium]|jgi:hydrogenase nickel incorporation protein HypA/HybF|nr:hydrogenase maturation nickel metallochaperone HypA [Bifidobacteriaceae bacterium]
MHELSLCRSIAAIAHRAAAGRQVKVIELDVGALRQVVPHALEHCWRLVSAATDLAGAQLAVNQIPARLACRECGETTDLDDLPAMVCGPCGSTNVQVTSGDEFLVRSLEVV